MTADYIRDVRRHLVGLSRADRRHALSALAAQLDELAELGSEPVATLGDPASYAAQLLDSLARDPGAARWSIFGIPVETRGPLSAEVRARTWDPTNPSLVVPRLFGLGWTLNLGALAVRLGLIREDDSSDDVLAHIPRSELRIAHAVPMLIAAGTATALAFAWRGLPSTVASGFGPGGRPRGQAPRWTLLGAAALGLVPAIWARRGTGEVEDRLVRSATATSLAVLSAGAVAATVAEAHQPGRRWGLLTVAALPVAVAGSLGVLVVPLRSGLRRAWATASPAPTPTPSEDQL